MCRIFKVHFSGFYAWLEKPLSNRAIEDQRLLKRIKQFYTASGASYGSPWIHRDMREAGETCSVHRVARIMRENKIKAQIGYKRRYINSTGVRSARQSQHAAVPGRRDAPQTGQSDVSFCGVRSLIIESEESIHGALARAA